MPRKRIYVRVDNDQPVFTSEYNDGIMSCWRGRNNDKIVFLMSDPDYVFVSGTWQVEVQGQQYHGGYTHKMTLRPNQKKLVADLGGTPSQNIVFDVVVDHDPNSIPDLTQGTSTKVTPTLSALHAGHGGGRLRY